MYKLHGSLNWRVRYDGSIVRIVSEEKVSSKNYKNNLVVYPSEKVKPEQQPFRKLHELFQEHVNEVPILIFIGFAFRDEYINTVLRNGKAKILIVSPHASELLKKRSLKLRSVYALDAAFGTAEFASKLVKSLKENFG